MATTGSAPSHLYSRCLLHKHNPTEKTDGKKKEGRRSKESKTAIMLISEERRVMMICGGEGEGEHGHVTGALPTLCPAKRAAR
jgi:hypothetical protein